MRTTRYLFARFGRGFTISDKSFNPRPIDNAVKENFPVVDEHASTNVRDYLKERGFSDHEISAIPDNFFKRITSPTHLMLIDREVARLIALTVCARSKCEHILEFDAGVGVMSEVLLPFTRNLRLYTGHTSLATLLEEKYKNELNRKVNIFDRSFTNILGILYSRVQDPTAFQKLVEGIPLRPWTIDIPVSIITPLLHVRFMKGFVTNFLEENSLKQFGRPEFYFLIPKSIANCFLFRESCISRNLPVHFLLHIFFDVEILLSDLPREAFLPWKMSVVKNKILMKMSDDSLFLVHAVPRLERFEPFEERSFLIAILTFMTSALRTTSKRIIPTFESFVPHCGPRFIIEDDLTVYTTFNELTPEKCFHLFKKLSCYPEFDINMLQKYTDGEKLNAEIEDEDEEVGEDGINEDEDKDEPTEKNHETKDKNESAEQNHEPEDKNEPNTEKNHETKRDSR